jgi:hypothetical protein
VRIGIVAIAKMTAMSARASRRKREISAVMRPAVMAVHVLVWGGIARDNAVEPFAGLYWKFLQFY